MNEKFKKLALNCRLTEQDIEQLSPALEIFAKHLVQHCAIMVSERELASKHTTDLNETDLAIISDRLDAAIKIREMFDLL